MLIALSKHLLPQPLLAVDFGSIMCVATIVMMFVGWILNMVNAKKRPTPAARRGGRQAAGAGDDRLQSEIDSFLQEVGGGRRSVESGRLEIEGDDLELELVEEEPLVRRRRRRPQSLPAQPEKQANTGLSERHLHTSIESRHLSTALQDHVADHMQERVVDDGTHQRRDAYSDQRETISPASQLSGRIAGLLQNPATVRQAILISEVLSPPKSRRK